jgi:hypothetical protein
MADNVVDNTAAAKPSFSMPDNYVEDTPEIVAASANPLPAFLDEETEDGSVADSTVTSTEVKTVTPANDTKHELLDVMIGDKVSKIKVDMSNTEQIKKAIVSSVQAKHIVQQQKEQLVAHKKELEELRDYQTSFGQVKTAFESKGVEGIVDLMTGKEGAYSEFMEKQVARALLRRDASPVELERLELEERLEQLQKSVKGHESRAKESETRASQQAEQAERSRIEGAIQPAFDKHRFAGQLGDPVLEARMDKMVWITAMDELKEFAAQNGQASVTPQVTGRIFSEIASGIRGSFSTQANKEAITSAEKRKADAAFTVAATANAAQGSGSSRQTDLALYNEYIRTGKMAKAMEMVSSGKVK